jgi:hypothetical protein
MWLEGWRSSTSFELDNNLYFLWENYILDLRPRHIRLIDREDELVWKKVLHGVYTPKLGYIALNINFLQRETCCWLRGLWKLKFTYKAKIFMWYAINDKVPTWDNMR